MDRGVPKYGGVVDPAGERARLLGAVGGLIRYGFVRGVADHSDNAETGGMTVYPG